MLRALFVEYPEDAGSWLIDDQYLFGSDMLVAPLFENVDERDVYLPPGKWIDYQTGEVYEEGWHSIEAGEIPIIALVRDESIIPHIGLAQSTKYMDWSKLKLKVYSTTGTAEGILFTPESDKVEQLRVQEKKLAKNPYGRKVRFTVE